MPDPRAQRTLVKSPPELWAEVSDVGTLARHLGEFGEIRITRTEPETTVVWEGDRACGTVELEPAGWGTKVTLTASVVEPEAVAEPEAEPEATAPEPEAAAAEAAADALPEPEAAAAEPAADAPPEPDAAPAEPAADASPDAAAPRRRLFARFFGRRRPLEPRTEPEPVAVEPEPEPEPEPVPEPVAVEPEPEPAPAPEPERAPVAAEPEPAPAPVLDAERAEAVLVGVLDDLGSAHHRPFSRG